MLCLIVTGPQLQIDESRLLANARRIKAHTRCQVYAVLKADAYGLGAHRVSRMIRGEVDGFYVFDLAEALEASLGEVGLPIIALDQPWKGYGPGDYQQAKVRPIVFSAERARQMRDLNPVLSVDTGMRRFACPEEQLAEALEAGGVQEVMTHASRMEQVERLRELCGGRGLKLHAAASTLQWEPSAQLDAVRPGLALYEGVATVTSRVVEVRSLGKGEQAGYTQFEAGRVGVILGGYTDGLKTGPCLVNGTRRRILEVGMQTSFVELREGEALGTEVVLLGQDPSASTEVLTEAEVGKAWGTSPQEVLVRLCGKIRKI